MSGNLTNTNHLIRDVMPEAPWHTVEIMQKFIPLFTTPWPTSSATGIILNNVSIPDIIVLKNTLQKQILGLFAFFRGSLVLRFQLNSTPFHQGRVIIFFDPFNQMNNDYSNNTQKFANIYSATGMPNVVLDASQSSIAELEIPFTHFQTLLTTINSTESFDLLGTVRIMVLNQLGVATGGSTTVNITTQVRMKDVALHVPIYPHVPAIPNFVAQGLMDFIPGPVSDIANSVSGGIADITTGDFGGALRKGGDLFDKVKGFFGNIFDKPVDPMTSTLSYIFPVQPFCHTNSKDAVVRLSTDPRTQYLIDPAVMGSKGPENDLFVAAQRYMLIEKVPWSTTDAGETSLTSFVVAPTTTATLVNGVAKRYYSTFLSYISQAFCYWKGGIRFRLEVVATRFHTGRLLIALNPGAAPSDTPPTFEQMLSLPNLVMDLQEARSAELTCPFYSNFQWKQVVGLGGSNPSGIHSTGNLYIMVLNPLAAPNGVPTSIEINVSIAGSSDIQFAVPTSINNGTTTDINIYDATAFHPTFVPQGLQDQQDQPPTDSSDLGMINSLSNIQRVVGRDSSYCEDFSKVENLIRRYQFFDYYTMNSNTITTDGITPSPLASMQTTRDPHTATFLTWFSRMYANWHGSLSWILFSKAGRLNPGMIRAIHLPDRDSFPSQVATNRLDEYLDGYASAVTNPAQQAALPFQTPFYSRYTQLVTETVDTNMPALATYLGTIQLGYDRAQDTAPTSAIVQLFQAAGEDFHLSYLVAPPVVYGPA